MSVVYRLVLSIISTLRALIGGGEGLQPQLKSTSANNTLIIINKNMYI